MRCYFSIVKKILYIKQKLTTKICCLI